MMASLRIEESKSSFSLIPKTLALDSCDMPTNNNSLETEPVSQEDSGLQRCKVSLLYGWEYFFKRDVPFINASSVGFLQNVFRGSCQSLNLRNQERDYPGGPVVRAPGFQCR